MSIKKTQALAKQASPLTRKPHSLGADRQITHCASSPWDWSDGAGARSDWLGWLNRGGADGGEAGSPGTPSAMEPRPADLQRFTTHS
eukprot:1147753-Pelagomonas_calceolata.AAC.4